MRKNVFVWAFVMLALTACSGTNWEYKTLSVSNQSAGDDSSYLTDVSRSKFALTDNDLNKLGAEGWELVSVYTLNETSFPNFGSSEYVTGIRENVRTAAIKLVFKRQK